MNLNFRKLTASASIPTSATTGAGAYDLYAAESREINGKSWGRVPIGIAVEVPRGYVGLIFSRSGKSDQGLVVANGVGVIDSDYRGGVEVILRNRNDEPIFIGEGDRIAQFLLLKTPELNFLEIKDANGLTATDRGADGFGSTGR